MDLLITLRNVAFFLISRMVSSLLIQLQIFKQLYLIELFGLLAGIKLLKLWDLYVQEFAFFGCHVDLPCAKTQLLWTLRLGI